jgi:hypothetical protein
MYVIKLLQNQFHVFNISLFIIDEFKVVLNHFNRLPQISLKLLSYIYIFIYTIYIIIFFLFFIDEFKIVLNQFNRLPLMSLKVASCAINCDDTNDHRKYVKKNKLSCTLLSDPSRQVLSYIYMYIFMYLYIKIYIYVCIYLMTIESM